MAFQRKQQHNYYRNNGREQYRQAIADDDIDAMRQVVQRRGQPQRGKSYTNRGRGRKNYNDSRVVEQRRQTSLITENDLAEELKNKLFPGVKTGQNALERLEALNTFKAITLTVTTRAMGFRTNQIFFSLYEYNNVPVTSAIYEMYRVCLAVFEVKVKMCQRAVTAIQGNEDDYAPLISNEDMIFNNNYNLIIRYQD